MADTEILEAVKAEIHRLKKSLLDYKYLTEYEQGCNFGRKDACDWLLSYIDSLQNKKD